MKKIKTMLNKLNPLKVKKWMNLKIFSILLAFVVGLVFCTTVTTRSVLENMRVYENFDGIGDDEENGELETHLTHPRGFDPKKDCHNVLVRDGKKLYLYNNQKANVPGVNPIVFDNLEEYTEYVKWERKMGRHCPVLYMRKTFDAQNKLKMRLAPDPLNEMGGLNTMPPLKKLLDANEQDGENNANMQPGYDPENQYIGIYTPLDKMFHDKHEKSASPMDSNWGGEKYSRKIAENINREREAAMKNRHAVTIGKPSPDKDLRRDLLMPPKSKY